MTAPKQKNKSITPSSPRVPLGAAVALTRPLWEKYGTSPMSLRDIAEMWRYERMNAAFFGSVAALKQFGLMEEVSSARPRRLKLTTQARHIITKAAEDPMCIAALQQAATGAYFELWFRSGNRLKTDEDLERQVQAAHGLRVSAARDLVRRYRLTVAYARLETGPSRSHGDGVPQVDDLVQWDGPGFARPPGRVTVVSHTGEWIGVDGWPSPVRVEQVRIVTPAPRPPTREMPNCDPAIERHRLPLDAPRW